MVLWCALFGLLGQALRSIVGLYKLYMDEIEAKPFNKKRFIVSLIIGASVGALCSFIFIEPLRRTDIPSIIAFGYMGVDSIEGFMSKKSSELYE